MANSPIDVESFWTPWEHRVCTTCYRNNPYAIWLVKVRCFQPHRHLQHEHIRVVVDTEDMVLEPVRPMPRNYKTIRGAFIMCQSREVCNGCNESCSYAHTGYEFDMWNFKQKLTKGRRSLVEDMCRHYLDSQCPSVVCQVCFEANSRALWLAWLKCTNTEHHRESATVTVVTDSLGKQLINVHPLPVEITQLSQVKICNQSGESICNSSGCQNAHSNGELLYWQWQMALRTLFEKDDKYKGMSKLYGFPDEHSEIITTVLRKCLTVTNYHSKFHTLVYLEEMESSRKIISECDSSSVTIRLEWSEQESKYVVHLMNLDHSSLDYASHGRYAEVVLTLAGSNQQYSAQILGTAADYEKNAIMLNIPLQSTFFVQCVPPSCLTCELKASVHFDVDHQYYHRLHKGIDRVSEDILAKLIPDKKHIAVRCPESLVQVTNKDHKYSLDRKYQFEALKRMFACSSNAPYLLLGPFGTGKTYLLAVAVAKLVNAGGNRVLVCTHLNRGADGLYKSLQGKRIKGMKNYVARVVGSIENTRLRNASVIYPDENVLEFPVVVTTFGIAIKLIDFVASGALSFSHILIDEGAQCPEPEVLGALALASRHTKIIIVGDNKQVGPRVRVLSERARDNGLGDSLLERLYSHYKEVNRGSLIKSHTSTLLTNYRCHPSILMLASSLFYECTLISQAERETHPKAPYPLVFTCTCVKQSEFNNCSAENEEEAKLLLTKMIEYIQTWEHTPKEPIGLLASTKQQVACLRRNWRQMKKYYNFQVQVEILPTYNIQGEEFSAVFLSTTEPTNEHGAPTDPIKSICNEYVFNTVVTRAQSLIFVVGNPFFLLCVGSQFKTNCWIEYIRRCIQSQSFELPRKCSSSEDQTMAKVVGQICERVLLGESIQQAKEEQFDTEEVDVIVERYLSDLNDRREFKIATKLVQSPSGDMSWVEQKIEEESNDEIVWCKLDCKTYRNAVARPVNKKTKEGVINLPGGGTVLGRRGILHGGIVRVDVIRKQVLFDEETEQALVSTHFGTSFLCRVDPKNPILFFPLDRRYPKFANLPVLSVRSKSGVVCFDPKSINSSVKVSNFIPLEVAKKMLFMVKFLGWEKWRRFPLGIIVAALPHQGHSPYIGELVMRISNNILPNPVTASPVTPASDIDSHVTSIRVYTGAFTIDPKDSYDHDDAITCKLVRTTERESVYEVGVHITDVQRYIPKDSELDKQALLRGCAAYCSLDGIRYTHCMLPEEMIQDNLSIAQGTLRNAFSVIARYSVGDKHVQYDPRSVTFIESKVQNALELTYEEAQKIINRESLPHNSLFSDDGNVIKYNCQPHNLKIEKQLKVLWKIVMFLRQERLGEDAAYSMIIDDADNREWPEAHFIIQELMIWTNHQVAVKILNSFPTNTILRVQNRLEEEEYVEVKKLHGQSMATSLALRSYGSGEPVDRLHILNSVYTGIRESLDNNHLLHCIQFEHLHPQIAVAIADVHQIRRSRVTDYIVSSSDEQKHWHDTLQCDKYTHFTSPIRRYIDIVIQRLLHAVLTRKDCPYSGEELQKICWEVKEVVRQSNNYDREVKRLDLATNLCNMGQYFICFVQRITEDAHMKVVFADPLLKVLHDQERSIALKHLNALSIPQEREHGELLSAPHNSSSGSQLQSGKSSSNAPFVWQAKIASFQGTAAGFFSNSMLQVLIKDSSIHDQRRYAEINLLSPEHGIVSESSNLIDNKITANIHPLTHAVPGSDWVELQQIIKSNQSDPDGLVDAIRTVMPFDYDNSKFLPHPGPVSSPSPLWIYKLYRPIDISEVLNVQLSARASSNEYLLYPELQLIEVGPELRICVQHNRNASECFADKLVDNASRRTYQSMEQYHRCWEPVLVYEAVVESLSESELLFIRDVSIKWPELQYKCDSLGEISYQLSVPAGENKAGAVLEIPADFMKMSYEFFTFKVGDLLCIRYRTQQNGKKVGFVLHMIIHHVDSDGCSTKGDNEPKKVKVYLKFVGQSYKRISPRIAQLLMSSDCMRCEVQLLPLTLPFRRIYRCLNNFRMEASPLALQIAKGAARMMSTVANLRKLDTIIPAEAASIWPITRRDHGSGRKKLNRLQREAIQIACNTKFTIIQGPPGTGKSVTGAHLAYALAKKLHGEYSSFIPSTSPRKSDNVEELKPCVMYCGPSNQAVNVVLNYLIQDGVPVKSELKILRVFSKTIEQKDCPGPNLHEGVFPKWSTSEAKCESQHEEYALHKKIRKFDPEIGEMDREFEELHKQHKIPSIAMRRRYRSKVHRAELAVLKSGFDIILCTCNEASSHRIARGIRPVYCIIDECAMCTEPESMVPIQRADHVVLIGDHQQLRPVIKSREAEAKGLGTSLFERYAMKDKDCSPLQKPHMLTVQYRMHEELCKFPSKEFYDNKLTTDYSVKNRGNAEAHISFWPRGKRKPFIFINIEGIERESHTGRKGKARVGLESKYNQQEADKIVEIAAVLVNQHKVSPTSLLALTPYSSQKEEIKNRLKAKKMSEIAVKTITESQGSESGIVLLSTVRSKPRVEIGHREDDSGERKTADIGWIRRNLGFVTDRHQICVGLTRCKYGLVIVGNKYLLSYDQTWRKLIDHYKENSCIVDGSNFPRKPNSHQ